MKNTLIIYRYHGENGFQKVTYYQIDQTKNHIWNYKVSEVAEFPLYSWTKYFFNK